MSVYENIHVPFKWASNTCVLGSWSKPDSKCFFDFWSFQHLVVTGYVYAILLLLIKPKTTILSFWLLILVNFMHLIEEYLGNTVWWNLEGLLTNLFLPLFSSSYKRWDYIIDHDSLQNSIGDVVSGIVGTLFVYWYWEMYHSIPIFWFTILFLYAIYLAIASNTSPKSK